MATKRKIVRKLLTAKFRRHNKAKVRKTIKLTKSKRHHKKRKHNTKRRRQKGGDENDDVCPICQEKFNAGDEIITTCNGRHNFHRNEIIHWCRGKNVCPCPICKQDIRHNVPAAPNNPNQNNLVNPNIIGIAPPGTPDYSPPAGSPDYSPDYSPVGSPDYSPPGSPPGLHAEHPTYILESFIESLFNNLSSMPYEPLPEAPYLVGADLPDSNEGGPKERIKNLLICLFSDEHYFHSNFEFFINCRDLGMEIVDDSDEAGVGRLKVVLISKMMNVVNDNLNYTDIQLRRIITHFFRECAANALGITLRNEPGQEVAPPRRAR